MILWALAGETVSEGLKRVATVAATHGSQTLGKSALKKLPSQAFKQVNKALWPLLGKHLITKGPKGLLALGKLIPVAGQATGAIAGATVDWYFCHQAVDFAEKHVFGMIIKEEEELRNWLVDESFDSNIEELLVKKHHLDIESICEINKAELEELGLSIGHALRLQWCQASGGAVSAWHPGPKHQNNMHCCGQLQGWFFSSTVSARFTRSKPEAVFPRICPFSYQISIMIYGGCGSSISS